MTHAYVSQVGLPSSCILQQKDQVPSVAQHRVVHKFGYQCMKDPGTGDYQLIAQKLLD